MNSGTVLGGSVKDSAGRTRTILQMGRKSTQRERVLKGMIRVTDRDGYHGASVSAVITEAGVSRPTFYEHFVDREDCFVASIAFAQEHLMSMTDAALESSPPSRALACAVGALINFVNAERELGRFLTAEAMAGGPRAPDARDQGIARIASAIEKAHRRVSADMIAPDLESRVLIVGVYRLLATRLRRGERWISKLSDELTGWIGRYEQPAGQHRWRALRPAPALSPFVPAEPLHMPSPAAAYPTWPNSNAEPSLRR